MGILPIDIVKDLPVLSSILSMAASIKKLMAQNNLVSEQAIEEFRRNASKRENDILEDNEKKNTIIFIANLEIISVKLLAQLSDEAQACEDKHVDDRKKAAGNITRIDQASADASDCMCRVLRDIRRHNCGELPAGPEARALEDFWKSYRCKI